MIRSSRCGRDWRRRTCSGGCPQHRVLVVCTAVVLAPTVAMEDEAGCDGALTQGLLLEGFSDELGAQSVQLSAFSPSLQPCAVCELFF